MTDQQLHAKAIDYQVEHRCSYADALQAVAGLAQLAASEGDQAGVSGSSGADAQLHRAASALMYSHNVTYAEGLRLAAASFSSGPGMAAFAEGAAAPAPFDQAVQIFRAGTHTTDAGQAFTFSAADLREIARRYDPALHEAPVCIGHPATNRPAYGWVSRLEAQGETLYMRAHQVSAAFAEMVRAGSYKKRSAAFYPPGDPANPTPGHWYLRHVGYLGAQPPAVKGLDDPTFGEARSATLVTFAST